MSLPSLRIDSAAVQLARFGAEQRGSVTLAPEAGTQGCGTRINKGVDEAQVLGAVEAVFRGGFTGLKLYFMIGLPGETDDDAVAIARLAGEAARLAKQIARGRARLSIAVSSYVPKAHTPFENEPFAGEETLRRRQEMLRAALPPGVRVSFHDVGASLVEATWHAAAWVPTSWWSAPGGCGARFDGWSEHFDLGVWREAATAEGAELGEPAGAAEHVLGVSRSTLAWTRTSSRRSGARPRRAAHRGLPHRALRRLRRVRRGRRDGDRGMSRGREDEDRGMGRGGERERAA